MRHNFRMAFSLVCLLLVGLGAAGQRVTSEIQGTVTDPSGAVVQGASVRVRQMETAQHWATLTDSSGVYHVAGLLPGTYEVQVRHPGFRMTLRPRILLSVNQQLVLDLSLAMGPAVDTIEVTDQIPLVERTGAQLSNVVSQMELRELPLNGRDLFQLVMLQTGVTPTTNAGTSPWSDSGITKAAVQGTRPTMNNLTLDGSDINDPGFNIAPGGPTGAQLGVDGIREFRVLLSTYNAEYGRNAGANVQFVTRSGTNEVHGSMFEFHRNSALDARNFFDVGRIPPFIRHQFGGTLGGPIRRNRTFFFVNYEGLRERKGITVSTVVPDDNAHHGLLPSGSDPNALVNVGVNPSVAPFLALFPGANGVSIGRGVALLQTSGKQSTREDYGLLRIDEHLSDRDQLFARWTVDSGDALVPFPSTLVPGFPGERTNRYDYAMLSWQRLLSSNALNELKFNFNRSSYNAAVTNQYPLSISLEPNRALGAIAIAGLPLVGNNLIFPLGSTSNTFEVIDNAMWQRGRHSLKFGADIKRIQVNGRFDLFQNGQYLFSDLTGFGIPARSNNPSLEMFLAGIPFLYFGVDPAAADSARGFRQTYLGLYVQHDWQITRRLTLNTGLRWEYSSIPTEAHGRVSNIQNPATDAGPTVGRLWASVPLDLWSPRIGFAWMPRGKGTVVRGGFGLLRDQLWSNLYSDVRFYEPFYRALLYGLPNFQASPTLASVQGPIPPEVIGSFGVTYRPAFPYYLQYSFGVQHELAPNLMAELAYVGSRGVHLPRTGEANLLPAGGKINPNLGAVPLLVTDANSNYNSLQGRLQKRLSAGLTMQASYTWSKALDDQSGPFPSDWVSESGTAQDFFNRHGDHGRASFDRRHVFVFNSLYDLPLGAGHRWGSGWGGRLEQVAGGWRVGTILSAMSGLPFTVNLGQFNNSGTRAPTPADRPDLKPGVRPCSGAVTSGDPARWFDPTIFTLPAAGQFGNAGRNIMCGPALFSMDLALLKVVKLGEHGPQLQFRAELFNLLNHPNFDVPVNTQASTGSGGNGDAVFIGRRSTLADNVTPCTAANDPAHLGCGILAPDVGRITRTVTSSRQVQFALKLIF